MFPSKWVKENREIATIGRERQVSRCKDTGKCDQTKIKINLGSGVYILQVDTACCFNRDRKLTVQKHTLYSKLLLYGQYGCLCFIISTFLTLMNAWCVLHFSPLLETLIFPVTVSEVPLEKK